MTLLFPRGRRSAFSPKRREYFRRRPFCSLGQDAAPFILLTPSAPSTLLPSIPLPRQSSGQVGTGPSTGSGQAGQALAPAVFFSGKLLLTSGEIFYNYLMSDTTLLCSSCRQTVSPEFFFCPYCGKKLKENPLSTSVFVQLGIYLLSVFLPPLGLWPGVKYVRSEDKKAKTIGMTAIVLTIISTIVVGWYSYGLVTQLTQSLSGIGGF